MDAIDLNQAEQDGRVDYVEFLSSNIEEIKRFYPEVFGWEFTDYGPEYTSFTDSRQGGALAPEVTAGGPVVVLYVPTRAGERYNMAYRQRG